MNYYLTPPPSVLQSMFSIGPGLDSATTSHASSATS